MGLSVSAVSRISLDRDDAVVLKSLQELKSQNFKFSKFSVLGPGVTWLCRWDVMCHRVAKVLIHPPRLQHLLLGLLVCGAAKMLAAIAAVFL